MLTEQVDERSLFRTWRKVEGEEVKKKVKASAAGQRRQSAMVALRKNTPCTGLGRGDVDGQPHASGSHWPAGMGCQCLIRLQAETALPLHGASTGARSNKAAPAAVVIIL